MSGNLSEVKHFTTSAGSMAATAANKDNLGELELKLGSLDDQATAADPLADEAAGADATGAIGGASEMAGAAGAETESKASVAEPASCATEVPVFRLSDVVTFTGGAAARRRELEAGEAPALAELTTAETSIGASLRISIRLMGEAVRLIRTNDAWTDWSPSARVQRNRMAGQRKIGL